MKAAITEAILPPQHLPQHLPQSERSLQASGVYVLGMHRSGTSAATRVINLLGVPLGLLEDLLPGGEYNQTGHWESTRLIRFNDALLRLRSAAWWCPPKPVPDWPDEPCVAERLALGANVFRSIYHGRSWVWKDPRNSLTLPFWLRALDEPAIGVVLIRHPAEIAASLARRNRFPLELSVQLWERYFHNLLRALWGLPVLFATYDHLLADAQTWTEAARAFLSRHGVAMASSPDPDAMRSFVDPSLRHHGRDALTDVVLTPEQQRLYETLLGLVGEHNSYRPPELPRESAQTDVALAELQRRFHLAKPAPGLFHSFMALHSPSAARRRPGPKVPASIIVIAHNEGQAVRRTLESLRSTSPPGVEVVLVDDNSNDGSCEDLPAGLRVTVVRQIHAGGIARARQAGVDASRGDLLIFSDAHVEPSPGWFDALAGVAARPDVGAVAPALTPMRNRANAYHGLRFVDAALNVRWVQAQNPQAHPTPLLAGCFFGIRRHVFRRVGGFDPQMRGYGSEDLELCLRLWRLGLECWVVPEAVVAHRFRRHGLAADESFLGNLLRMGFLHLSRDNLQALLSCMRSQVGFSAIVANNLMSDSFSRRQDLESEAWADDEWFFRRFQMRVGGAAREREDANL